MSKAKGVSCNIARAVARRIVDERGPACERIEVVGSLRRGRPTVHDIDIVLLPRSDNTNVLENPLTPLDRILDKLVERGSLTPVRGKEKTRSFLATKTGIPLDIYVADADTWATLMLIRTGSKEHNIQLAQRARKLRMKLRASGDGLENERGELLRVYAEEEIFSLLGLRYVRPEHRG
jgi:DNA polymerase/3'-5' exonuclease PolX